MRDLSGLGFRSLKGLGLGFRVPYKSELLGPFLQSTESPGPDGRNRRGSRTRLLPACRHWRSGSPATSTLLPPRCRIDAQAWKEKGSGISVLLSWQTSQAGPFHETYLPLKPLLPGRRSIFLLPALRLLRSRRSFESLVGLRGEVFESCGLRRRHGGRTETARSCLDHGWQVLPQVVAPEELFPTHLFTLKRS